MIVCWRCKQPFEPENSYLWPNIKETCPACVSIIMPGAVGHAIYGAPPDRLLADVQKDPIMFQAETILKERGKKYEQPKS